MAIVDTANGFNVEKRDMKAEGILMHRERNVIAVRAPQGDTQTIVQVCAGFDFSRSFLSDKDWSIGPRFLII